MLLTITTTHRPATDLGFLLNKHPERVQTFSVPFGEAHVFYPEASEQRCTAALLLDIDPVGLVRRGRGVSGFALAEYTPVADAAWLNNTINIDTGCVFGGRLTALRWPERELVSVPASRTHFQPAKPFLSPDDAAPVADEERPAFLLDVDDVAGKRIVQTRFARTVTVREENAAAALEIMSRFATDPRWLVYLPPTMTPTATSSRPDLLEHPEEAFAEYRSAGVPHVICEEKHMGSRAIVVVCRDADVARERFGADDGETGAIYTRTGRPFLAGATDTEAALSRVRGAVESAGLWDELGTGWLVLDCELLPWSAKAIGLIRRQYASVGSAARAGLSATVAALQVAEARGLDVTTLLDRQCHRIEHVEHYVDAYRRYVWPVDHVSDLRLAPFHVLAAETGASSTATTPGTSSAVTDSSRRTPIGFGRPAVAESTSPTPTTRWPALRGGKS